MKKSEIIRTFLDRGLQITGDALEFFAETPERLDCFFSKKLHYPPTVTLDFVREALKSDTDATQPAPHPRKERLGVRDFTDFLNKRYTFLANILNKRLDLVNLISMNKISEKTKKFSIIGTVEGKDNENKAIAVEDRTGKITVRLSENDLRQIVEDEVIGIVCERDNQTVSGQKIVFPDVPLQREISKTKEDNYIFFLSDFHMDFDNFKKGSYKKLIDWLKSQDKKLNIFVLGNVSKKKEDIETFLSDIPKIHNVYIIKGETDGGVGVEHLSNPAFFQMETVKLLMSNDRKIIDYMNIWGTPEQTIINLVKKRHLNPTISPDYKLYDNDPYLLDTTPDIIAVACTLAPSVTNYKGITLITTGSFITQPIFWLINLRTRETFKIDFS